MFVRSVRTTTLLFAKVPTPPIIAAWGLLPRIRLGRIDQRASLLSMQIRNPAQTLLYCHPEHRLRHRLEGLNWSRRRDQLLSLST